MTWHEQPMCMFDVETTGVDPHRDRIVTAAVITAGRGQAAVEREWLLTPDELGIPEQATQVHGVTEAHARANGVDRTDALRDIAMTLTGHTKAGVPIVGHNVRYDITILRAELLRHNLTSLANGLGAIRPVIDTMVLDRQADPWRPKQPTQRRPDPAKCGSRRLIDTCRVHGITLTEDEAHGATADARAAGRLAWAIARTTPCVQIPLDELHQAQQQWAREQAESFAAWLTKHGKPDDVDREWPVATPPTDWHPTQEPRPRQDDAA